MIKSLLKIIVIKTLNLITKIEFYKVLKIEEKKVKNIKFTDYESVFVF